mgnify:CR=1 FL=1
MTVIAQSGFSAEVKALITKYGARKLSDIDPSQYESLLKEADALGKSDIGDPDDGLPAGTQFLNLRIQFAHQYESLLKEADALGKSEVGADG